MHHITKVLKFGGTSVGSPNAIRKVFEIVNNYLPSQHPLIVVSAFAGITDSLVQLYSAYAMEAEIRPLCNAIFARHQHAARELGLRSLDPILGLQAEFEQHLLSAPPFTASFRDKLLSFGERLSASILASYFSTHGIPSVPFDARQVVVTDDHYGMAKVDFAETYQRIRRTFSLPQEMPIVTGFIGSNRSGETTTLGRGGSDFTASLFGVALQVDEIEIWTDVNGICSSDPNIDTNAQTLSQITYEQALSISIAGAKVIHSASIPPAQQAGIPIRVKNTFNPEHSGTFICSETLLREDPLRHAHQAA